MSEERQRGERWRERRRLLREFFFFFFPRLKKKRSDVWNRRNLASSSFSTNTATRSWAWLSNAKAAAVVSIKSKFVCLSQLGGGATSFRTPTPRNRRACLPPPRHVERLSLVSTFPFFFVFLFSCFFLLRVSLPSPACFMGFGGGGGGGSAGSRFS